MKDFLLKSDTAKMLYSSVEKLPIIDYHNHLSVADISENKRFSDIYELWIKPDPYKHRAMRMCGVSERYITGDASDFDKFAAWCGIFPNLVGNPLYIWSQMELQSIFGITEIPCKDNAENIYNKANEFLRNNEVTAESLLKGFGVELSCPCVSLCDDVSVFEKNHTVFPSLRGDDATAPSLDFIRKLESLTHDINNLSDYKLAVSERLDLLKNTGCIFSDHALDNGFVFYNDDGENEKRFMKILDGKALKEEDEKKLFSYILEFLCSEYAKKGFTVQLHIGAERYTSSRLRTLAGKAGGFAAIGNSVDISSFTKMLDTFEKGEYGLPKMVLFTLNPADNAMLSVLAGSYSKDGVPGLISQGPAWWWCDHKHGICDALENISSFGLLSNFVGMTTDSRSFLSFVRHDYFRRILCQWLAEKYDSGEFCCSYDSLEALAKDMCYENAKRIIGGIHNV